MLSSGNSHCGETLDKAYFSTKGTTVHPVAQAKAVQSALISYFPSLSTSIHFTPEYVPNPSRSFYMLRPGRSPGLSPLDPAKAS